MDNRSQRQASFYRCPSPKNEIIDKPFYKMSLISDFNQLYSQESQEIPSEIPSKSLQFNILALTLRNLTFT